MQRRDAPSFGRLRTIASFAPAALVALCALVSLAYAAGVVNPALDTLDSVLPIDPNDSTQQLAWLSAIGFGALTVGLIRNKAFAWLLTVATLVVSLLTQSDLPSHPILIGATAIAFGVLLANRRRYEVQTGIGWRRVILVLLIAAGVVLGFQLLAIIIVTDDWPRPVASLGDLTWALANALGLSDDAGQRVLQVSSRDALLGLLVLVARLPIVLAAIGILARVPEPEPDPTTRSRARSIAARYGSGALLPYQLGEDKFVFEPADTESFVVYGLAGRTAVVLGGQVGPKWEAATVLREFVEHCRRRDRIPVVYQATPEGRRVLSDAGFRTFKVGEEAVIDLAAFDLAGSRRANLRHTVTRCRRDGVDFRWYPTGLPRDAALVGQLQAVDAAWRAKAGPQMGFTIGEFDPASIAALPVAVALDPAGAVLGFTTFRPTGVDGGWVLDLMRRREPSPPGVVEGCIAEAARGFREMGATSLSLGLAPLSGLDGAHGPLEERLLARGGQLVRRWYDVKGLYFFKNKFDPTWIPRYGAIRHRRDLLAFVLGLLWVHLAGAIQLPRRRHLKRAAAT